MPYFDVKEQEKQQVINKTCISMLETFRKFYLGQKLKFDLGYTGYWLLKKHLIMIESQKEKKGQVIN